MTQEQMMPTTSRNGRTDEYGEHDDMVSEMDNNNYGKGDDVIMDSSMLEDSNQKIVGVSVLEDSKEKE